MTLVLLGTLHGVSSARDVQLEDRLARAQARGELDGLHAVRVLHRGQLQAEVYVPGDDERWGAPLGRREHGPDTLHDLRSVTKSIVALLYGIALEEGLVPPVGTRLSAGFPEHPEIAADVERSGILVRDALSMQMGLAWNESLPYSDPRNSEIAMERAADRYRFVLERPVLEPPGAVWRYNGGATALIGRLIAKGARMPLDAYAKQRLFEPLGITEFEWVAGADGEPSAASGLRLSAASLARIGQLVVDGGRVDVRPLVPASWLAAALTPRAGAEALRCGYFWWLAPEGDPPVWVAGFGNGGQRLSINPGLGVVVVVFAGNYDQPDAWKLPVKVIGEFVAPALPRVVGKGPD